MTVADEESQLAVGTVYHARSCEGWITHDGLVGEFFGSGRIDLELGIQ